MIKRIIVASLLVAGCLNYSSQAWFSSPKKAKVDTGAHKTVIAKEAPVEQKIVPTTNKTVNVSQVSTKQQPAKSTENNKQVAAQLKQTQSKYQAVVREIEKALSDARTKLIALQSNKNKLAVEIATTERAIKQLSTTNEQRYHDLEEQQQKLEQIEIILKEKNENVEALLDAIQVAKLMREKDNRLKKMKDEMLDLKVQSDALSKKNDQKIALLERENRYLKKQAIEQSEIISRLRTGLATLKQSGGMRQKEVSTLQRKIIKLQQAIASQKQSEQQTLEGVSSSIQEFEDFLSKQMKE